ncbi:Zinc/iron permease [Aspergillus granulosus]|uniref:Zinc/iron permease n=1 Tax=Aspergillus granulosus TaxID=176169 RepID=A0ABR4I7Q6_9EURO
MDTSSLLLRTLPDSDADADSAAISCQTGNEFNGNLALRISSIFVILIGSLAGILFPLLARPPSSSNTTGKPFSTSFTSFNIPPWIFFIAKFFGSGVIVATAFIHLLAPASEALKNPCLTGLITEYSWVEGIVLMTVIATFFVEILVDLFAGHSHTSLRGSVDDEGKDDYPNEEQDGLLRSPSLSETDTLEDGRHSVLNSGLLSTSHTSRSSNISTTHRAQRNVQNWKSHLTSLLILESGVIFHSIFIGLSLAVTGDEFKTLYAVLVFHQTFEGLGLGIRLADIPWPESKHSTPYLLGCAYALSTPVAITIGLLIRNSYSPESQRTLIVSGIFDSISAGILIYTGLVELMAREFLFRREGGKREAGTVLAAFFWLCTGAAAMAVLGKWA